MCSADDLHDGMRLHFSRMHVLKGRHLKAYSMDSSRGMLLAGKIAVVEVLSADPRRKNCGEMVGSPHLLQTRHGARCSAYSIGPQRKSYPSRCTSMTLSLIKQWRTGTYHAIIALRGLGLLVARINSDTRHEDVACDT